MKNNPILYAILLILASSIASATYYSDTTNLSGSAPVSDAGQYGLNIMVNVVNATLVSVEKYSNDASTRALLYNGSVSIENTTFTGNIANFTRPYLYIGTNYTIRTDNNGALRNVVCTSNGVSAMPIAGTGLNFTGVYNGCGAAYKAGSIIRVNIENVSGAPPVTSYLYVVKYISGGSMTIDNVTLKINTTTVMNASNTSLSNGTYIVTENITGFENNYTLAYSGDCDTNGIVQLGYNTSKVCILTNTFIPPAYLYVVKYIMGNGTMTIDNVTLSINTTTVMNASNTTLAAGTYIVTENITGFEDQYSLAYTGDCDASGVITLSPSDAGVCILTNTFTPEEPNIFEFDFTVNSNLILYIFTYSVITLIGIGAFLYRWHAIESFCAFILFCLGLVAMFNSINLVISLGLTFFPTVFILSPEET